jgi:nucleoside-diphosphate-sugar epimerase
MSVLVTGASGFVGAHVVDALIAAGHERVIAADLAPPASTADHKTVTYIPVDVTDRAAVTAMLAQWSPELIVHAAAITPSVEEEMTDAAQIMGVNAGGSANIVSAALAAGHVRRIVLFSSSGVYNGMSTYPDPLHEEISAPQVPSSLYAVTKLACEGLAQRAVATGRMSACAIRVASVYGEHERATASRKVARTSQIHKLATATASGLPVRTSSSNAGRDWIHGSDVGRAVAELLAASRLNHVVYNVASGQAVGFQNLIAIFRAEGLAVTGDPDVTEITMRAEDHRPPLDIARLAADTGFQPEIRLPDGIKALVAFHRSRYAP